jgi:hypothetical protein
MNSAPSPARRAAVFTAFFMIFTSLGSGSEPDTCETLHKRRAFPLARRIRRQS